MQRQTIPIAQFTVNAHTRWANDWFLLTAGDFRTGHFNTMTVAWGSFGTMWDKPLAQIVVRPTRYTFEFITQYPTFTLSGFPASYKSALQLLGSQSGRDGAKIAAAGLTPTASTVVDAPTFAQADLVIECRTMYWDDLRPEHFIDPQVEKNYPQKDYHRIFWGEILAVSGASDE